jgi:glycosyltransferase involved in cell wall biosynthesis
MSAFHIAVDAHWLVCRPSSGISTYLRGLLNGWAQSEEDLRVDLIVPFRPEPVSEVLLTHPKFRLVAPSRPMNPIASYRAQVYWQQLGVPSLVRRDKPDVYLSPFHLTPLALPGVRVVSTIHDVCFFSEPRFSRGRWLHTGQLWSACLRASRLICISHATHRALAEWSPTIGAKATVVHNGFEGRTIPSEKARAVVGQLDGSLIPQQYLLWVGIPCDRKNLGLLFEVFSAHQRRFPAHRFVIVTPTEFHAQIQAIAKWAGVETSVRIYSVDNATRDALYRCALAFIFPSSCEGFGYPALEAMVQGCPVVSLQRTAMQELLEGIIPLAAELTTAAFIEILSACLSLSEAGREAVGRRLIERAAHFSSREMAAKTLEILKNVGRSNN